MDKQDAKGVWVRVEAALEEVVVRANYLGNEIRKATSPDDVRDLEERLGVVRGCDTALGRAVRDFRNIMGDVVEDAEMAIKGLIYTERKAELAAIKAELDEVSAEEPTDA